MIGAFLFVLLWFCLSLAIKEIIGIPKTSCRQRISTGKAQQGSEIVQEHTKPKSTGGFQVRKDRSMALFVILVIIGALLGSIVGEILSKSMPILARGVSVGIDPPMGLNLFVLRLTFGVSLKLNVASALGILLALVLFRRS